MPCAPKLSFWGLVFLLSFASAEVCNVYDFGARGDGNQDDTLSIRSTLAACGGGANNSVLLPATHPTTGSPSVFLTGPVNLTQPNLTFILEGTLLASSSPSDYPVVAGLPSYFPDYWRWQPFLWVYQAVGVTVTGGGTVDGQGDAYFWPAWFNGTLVDPLNMHRPMLIEIYGGSDTTIDGIHTLRPGFWSIHPVYTTRFTLRNLDVHSPVGSPNCDGIDPDSSSYGLIENVAIANGDDCIAIKSGRGPIGHAFASPSHHLTLRNITLLHGLGITMGAEAAGGVHDIHVHNVTAKNTLTAVHVQSPRWLDGTWCEGGVVENLLFEDMAVQNVFTAIYFNQWWGEIEATSHPFPTFISPPPAPNATTPRFNNITVQNLRGLGSEVAPVAIDCFMVGNLQCLPEQPCTNITLTNITLKGYKHWACANVDGLVVRGVVDPDPALDGCAGRDSVVTPHYHASSFQ